MGRTYTGVGEKCEGGVAAMNLYRLTTTPHHPPSPCVVGWKVEKSGNEGVKLSLGKRGDRGKGVILILVFVSCYPNTF